MIVRRIVCWLFGHNFRVVMFSPYRFEVRCARCGRLESVEV